MTRSTRHPRPDQGSVYLLCLVALVVLTIVGLALSMVTQSEMRLGANERPIQRVFYAAGAGIAASTARALVSADYDGATFRLTDVPEETLLNFRHQVEVTPFYPILDSPCNLCEINNAGTYSERSYRRVNHALTARARRVAGENETRLAEKTLATMIDVHPWKTGPEAYLHIDNPEVLRKIKF